MVQREESYQNSYIERERPLPYALHGQIASLKNTNNAGFS